MKQIYILTLLFSIYNSTYSQQGNGLNFDGNDDFVSIDSNTVIDYSNDLTIEFNINSNHASNSGAFDRIFSSTNDNFEIAINNTSGAIYIYSPISRWNATGVNLTNNEWQHVGLVYDGSTVKLYLDGALESTINFSLPSTIPETIEIGSRVNGEGEYSNFSVDELRIWNLNRSATEIMNNISNELSLPQTGLIAYYKFNQGIANGNNSTEITLNDELGNNDGVLNNFALNGTTSNWIAGSTLSVNNFNSIEKNLAVYPNPASDYITVSELKKAENFEIYNLIGQNIRKGITSSDESINIQNLIKGIYLLKFENGNTLKFVKE